ncbi:MAG: type II secretion system F family protein [Candidatus Marinimicrobia bacterium]|nr:type II secretion system F family protein [Candidatus Neomarinimicrobiota bacterium]
MKILTKMKDLLKVLRLKLLPRKRIDVYLFIKQLSILTNANISLYKGLNVIYNNRSSSYSKAFLKTIRDVIEDVRLGCSFNEAIQKYPHYFDPLFVTLIKVGEEAGNLPKVLQELTNYINRRIRYTRKIKSALSYPTIVLSISLLTITVLVFFLLPGLTSMFSGWGKELPGLTRALMSISNYSINYSGVIVAVLVLLTFVGLHLFKNKLVQKKLLLALPKIPVVGDLIIKSQLQIYASMIATLLENEVPMLSTLKICRNVSKNVLARGYFEVVVESFAGGKSLSESMRLPGLIPDEIIHVISTGEESAELAFVFRRIDLNYSEEVEAFLEGLTSIIEPVIIVFLALIVGFILIAVYLPIFEMSTSITF